MTTFINLDISKKTPVTDYGFQMNASPLPTIYFLIYDEHYVIDYSKLSSFRILVQLDMSKYSETINLLNSEIVEIEGLKYIKWNVPSKFLENMDKLNITAIINYNGRSIRLNEFRIIVFNYFESETNAIITAIDKFNKMYQNYLTSVKRTEVGQPMGLVPLNENGRIDLKYINQEYTDHIPHTMYDTLYTIPHIHGLRINRETFEWEYNHVSDDEWYVVNSIHGGRFGYNNNPENYNVFGGYFTDADTEAIDGGNFNDNLNRAVDANSFNSNIDTAYDGGNFNEVRPPATGGGFNDKADAVTGGGFE